MPSTSSQASWYYTRPGSETMGPVGLDELQARVVDGTVLGETAVWTEAFGPQWRRADAVPELRAAWEAVEAARLRAVSQTRLATVPVRAAAAASLLWTRQALFRPFSFPVWLGIAFCAWLGGANFFLNFADMATLNERLRPGGDVAAAVLASLCAGLRRIFLPHVSGSWVLSVLLFTALTAYVCAKGRLMLLHKVYAPGDPLGVAWRRTLGVTRSLALFYTLVESAVNFAAAACLLRFLLAAGFLGGTVEPGTAALLAALKAPASGRWVAAGVAAFLLLKGVRAFAYHFVEPLVYRFSVPVSTAFRMAFGVVARDFGRAAGYALFVLAFRAAYYGLAALLLLFSGAALAAAGLPTSSLARGLPLLLLVVGGKLLLLPPDYFLRVLATRFLK